MASTLSWKVSGITYGCSNSSGWVEVEPSTGDGDATPTVKITAATGPDDCPSATIFISASTGQIQSIPVSRCIPECSCKSLDFKAVSVSEQEATGGSVKIGTYKKDCPCVEYAHVDVDGIVLCSPTLINGEIYATVSPNESEEPRTGWFRFRYNGNICLENDDIKQKGKQTKCAGEEICDVDPHAPSEFDANSHTLKVSISKCWWDRSYESGIYIDDTSMITSVDFYCDDCGEGNLGRAVYDINISNNTGNYRTAHVTFPLVNVDTGEVCESENRIVTINQAGGETPPVTHCCDVKSTGEKFIKGGTSDPKGGTCGYWRCDNPSDILEAEIWVEFPEGTEEWITGVYAVECEQPHSCGPTSDYDGRFRGYVSPNPRTTERTATVKIRTKCGGIESIDTSQEG